MIVNDMKAGERESSQAALYVCWETTGRYDIRRLTYADNQQITIEDSRSREKLVERRVCHRMSLTGAGKHQAPRMTRQRKVSHMQNRLFSWLLSIRTVKKSEKKSPTWLP